MSTNSILIVDDNAAHRRLIKRALLKFDITNPVIEADSIANARTIFISLQQNIPSVAIVDLHLGDGSGVTLIKELRGIPAYKELPIVVLSTSSLETDLIESSNNGANCYVTKADDIATFSADVARALAFLLPK